MNLLKIAWRNLWRSKTRTVLTAFVVFFVVILSTIMTSQQEGMYDNMINNVIEFSGHIQVQDTNYIIDKTINDVIMVDNELLESVESVKHVTDVSPRIESFSLASFSEKTKGVAVIGIDPDKEKNISKLDKKIARYKLSLDSTEFDTNIYSTIKTLNNNSYTSEEILRKRLKTKLGKKLFDEELVNTIISDSKTKSEYLQANDKDILIGEALAEYLEVNIGDTLVMLSQGYHGATAANLFAIKGFLKIPLKDIERRLVIMDINAAQEFYSTYSMATSLLVKVDNNNKLDQISASINAEIPEHMRSQGWVEMQPETVQMIDSDRAGGVFMKGIFYMIIGFIIFGTIMMMLSERKREFGILIAVGLKRAKLAIILMYETLFISMLGTLIGFMLSFPIIWFMHNNPLPLEGEMAEMMEDYGFEPVIFFSDKFEIFYGQALLIFIVSIIIFLFPLTSLRKLNIIKSIRG